MTVFRVKTPTWNASLRLLGAGEARAAQELDQLVKFTALQLDTPLGRGARAEAGVGAVQPGGQRRLGAAAAPARQQDAGAGAWVAPGHVLDVVAAQRQHVRQPLAPARLVEQRRVARRLARVAVQPASLPRRVDLGPHVVSRVQHEPSVKSLFGFQNLIDMPD